jgi:hypothetical protein
MHYVTLDHFVRAQIGEISFLCRERPDHLCDLIFQRMGLLGNPHDAHCHAPRP